MKSGSTIPIPDGLARILTRAEVQNCDAWKRAFRNKCKDHRYYEIVEETLEGDFEHHYLVLQDDSRPGARHSAALFCPAKCLEGVPAKMVPLWISASGVSRIF